MKIYKVWQHVNGGYDTHDSMVVVASSEKEAREIVPGSYTGQWIDGRLHTMDGKLITEKMYSDWAIAIEDVNVYLIGEAADTMAKGIVVSSFNAG